MPVVNMLNVNNKIFDYKGVFRALSNIHGRAFFLKKVNLFMHNVWPFYNIMQKELTIKILELFSQKKATS